MPQRLHLMVLELGTSSALKRNLCGLVRSQGVISPLSFPAGYTESSSRCFQPQWKPRPHFLPPHLALAGPSACHRVLHTSPTCIMFSRGTPVSSRWAVSLSLSLGSSWHGRPGEGQRALHSTSQLRKAVSRACSHFRKLLSLVIKRISLPLVS